MQLAQFLSQRPNQRPSRDVTDSYTVADLMSQFFKAHPHAQAAWPPRTKATAFLASHRDVFELTALEHSQTAVRLAPGARELVAHATCASPSHGGARLATTRTDEASQHRVRASAHAHVWMRKEPLVSPEHPAIN